MRVVFHLLVDTCYLMILHLRHCILYGLPSMLFFALSMYLLFSGRFAIYYAYISLGIFLLANTLFVFATCQEMLKQDSAPLNILPALIWRRVHNDFFLFIGLGLVIMALLAVYSVGTVGRLFEHADAWSQLQVREELRGGISLLSGGYLGLAWGAKIVSMILLGFTLWGWMYICRIGIRIPAYVEGYYLRLSEALELMHFIEWKIYILSLLFIISMTALMGVVAGYFEASPLAGAVFSWTIGYFVLVVWHVALWSNAYITAVIQSGYSMSRLV